MPQAPSAPSLVWPPRPLWVCVCSYVLAQRPSAASIILTQHEVQAAATPIPLLRASAVSLNWSASRLVADALRGRRHPSADASVRQDATSAGYAHRGKCPVLPARRSFPGRVVRRCSAPNCWLAAATENRQARAPVSTQELRARPLIGGNLHDVLRPDRRHRAYHARIQRPWAAWAPFSLRPADEERCARRPRSAAGYCAMIDQGGAALCGGRLSTRKAPNPAQLSGAGTELRRGYGRGQFVGRRDARSEACLDERRARSGSRPGLRPCAARLRQFNELTRRRSLPACWLQIIGTNVRGFIGGS